MKEIFTIHRDEFTEDGNDFLCLAIHGTLEGAIKHFEEIVKEERITYVYDETGSMDTSEYAMEMAGVEEAFKVDPDGTKDWHIWRSTSWHELFIHIYRRELLD